MNSLICQRCLERGSVLNGNRVQAKSVNRKTVCGPTSETQQDLLGWYAKHQRQLPWRLRNDPYEIWISETMLQQTTTAAVAGYFVKFLARFPDVHSLARASLSEVFELWSGLGYYSRARNLHKAALIVSANGGVMPKSVAELLELPGVGPYTARAVAAIAFEVPVGVVDGNTIRVLSRHFGEPFKWWEAGDRKQLQEAADLWVSGAVSPGQMNQALMELGATLCTPSNPACLLCPISASCQGRLKQELLSLPLRKTQRAREIWHWQPQVMERSGTVALIHNTKLPFLKGHWIFPGPGRRLMRPPKNFGFRHSITHHDIYVRVQKLPVSKMQSLPARKKLGVAQDGLGKRSSKGNVSTICSEVEKWESLTRLSQASPSSILKKIIKVVAPLVSSNS